MNTDIRAYMPSTPAERRKTAGEILTYVLPECTDLNMVAVRHRSGRDDVVRILLRELERQGLVENVKGAWCITAAGAIWRLLNNFGKPIPWFDLMHHPDLDRFSRADLDLGLKALTGGKLITLEVAEADFVKGIGHGYRLLEEPLKSLRIPDEATT